MKAIENRNDLESVQDRLALFTSLLHTTTGVQVFPKPLEEEFQACYNENTRFVAKITLFLGLFFLLPAAFLIIFFPTDFYLIAIRLLIATPLLLVFIKA